MKGDQGVAGQDGENGDKVGIIFIVINGIYIFIFDISFYMFIFLF